MKRIKITPTEVDMDQHQLFLEIISNESFLSINKSIIKWCYKKFEVGIEMAAYISNLYDCFKYANQMGKLQEDGSFYLRMDDQESQLGISKFRLRKLKQKLIDANIIMVEKRGLPAKDYYLFNFKVLQERFTGYLNTSSKETKPLGEKKLNHLPIYNKNILNKNKKSVFAKTQKIPSQEKRILPKEKILKFFSHLPDSWDRDEKLFQALSSYITHRQELGRGLTPTAIKTMAKKFSDYPKVTVIKALKASVENGWTGVFPENLEPKETQEKENTPPATIIKDYFNKKYNAGQRSKSTITRFTNTIFKPAVSFLPKHANGQASTLARNALTLFEEIEKTQSKIPDKKRVSLPGGLDILKDYVAWLDESDWIKNKDERLFNINSKVFKQFSQEAAQEWGGVNPVFG